MRAISKILTGSMIAAAALAVSACGSKTETTTDNTLVTDLNTTDTMSETVSDNMTAVDSATGNGVMANDMMVNETTTNTTTTNAM
ncbi:hypothetical protein BH09PSE4_BH09PSE4_16900 [soil metagenome]